MAILAYDDVMLREPRLLQRGLQPLGMTKIDTGHELARDLVFFWHGGSEVDLVTGTRLVITGTAKRRVPVGGNLAFETDDTTNDAISFALPGNSAFYTITNKYSIACKARIDATTNYSALVSVAWAGGSWLVPYGSFSFANQLDSYIRIWGAVSSSVNFSLGDSRVKIAVSQSPVFYGVTRDAASRAFFVGEIGYGGGSAPEDSNTTSSIDWNTKQPLTLLNRSSTVPGEGIDGSMEYCAIWKRALAGREMESMRIDPYQFLIPA